MRESCTSVTSWGFFYCLEGAAEPNNGFDVILHPPRVYSSNCARACFDFAALISDIGCILSAFYRTMLKARSKMVNLNLKMTKYCITPALNIDT